MSGTAFAISADRVLLGDGDHSLSGMAVVVADGKIDSLRRVEDLRLIPSCLGRRRRRGVKHEGYILSVRPHVRRPESSAREHLASLRTDSNDRTPGFAPSLGLAACPLT